MLAAPPDRLNLDQGALEAEGREKYLKSLETKLGRLQGSDKKKLTSKDIVSSISEAREDHMRQFMTTEATNDPWASHSPTAIRNEFAEFEFHVEDSDSEDQKPPSSQLCISCYCCGRRREAYVRARVVRREGEEGARLMDCDELDLNWQRESGEDVT